MDEGAAFGFFPQLRPRRRLQDPTASADVPLQVLRGRLAGLLGLPSDIGNIVRSPQPMEAFGSYEYEQPQQLPYTTEQFLKELPLAPTAPIGQLAGQAASFVPLNPAPLVRGVQKLGTMVGEGMAERVATGRPMLPSLLAEPQSAMFAVEPNVPRMNLLDTPPETMTSLLEVKPQAAVSDLGFYSAAEQAALNLQRNKGSGQAFLNDLLKAENVKKDELQWMGVDDFLKEKPNVTKQEVQDFITNNRVDVQEVRLGGNLNPELQTTRNALNDKYKGLVDNIADAKSQFEEGKISYSELRNTVSNNQIQIQALDTQINEINQTITPTKYQRYQLPGGENYREILMTLPEAMPNTALEIQQFTKRMETMRELQNEFANAGNMEKAISFAQKADDLQAYIKQLEKIPVTRQTENYQSSHFDEPNILAHIRVNDRVDADGKKMLLIEEIQSDWHQAGREKGYKKSYAKEDVKPMPKDVAASEYGLHNADLFWYFDVPGNTLKIPKSRYATQDEALKYVLTEKKTAGDVPDAPFKDTWYQLALKRVLKHAADNGYERVGLTTGKQQADRFNLAKQVDHIDYRRSPDGTFELGIADINGDAVNLPKARYAAEELPSLVGKEVADKIVKGEGQSGGGRMTLRGLDLQVGGEGMKKYYDEIYPKFLDKYAKKWNARVGETQITTDYARDANGIPAQRPSKESIRYIDITPEMKGAVSKGQPLFAATPALPLGGLLGEPEKKKELSLLD